MGFYKALDNLMGWATVSKDPQALSAVMEFQRQLIQIQEENRLLREENHEFKNEKIIESQLVYKEGYYVRTTDQRKICSKCWDKDRKMISTITGDYGQFCPVCEAFVG